MYRLAVILSYVRYVQSLVMCFSIRGFPGQNGQKSQSPLMRKDVSVMAVIITFCDVLSFVIFWSIFISFFGTFLGY